MVYILLCAAVTCSTIQNLITKQYNKSVRKPNMYIFSALVAATAMIFFIAASGGKLSFNGSIIGYSIAFAVSYSMAIMGNVMAISSGHLAISTLINQCSLIIPTMYGILILKEDIGVLGYAGIILLFACLCLVSLKNKPAQKNKDEGAFVKWLIWVTIGFIGNGMCSVIQKAQQLRFGGAYKNEFMITALAIGMIVMLSLAVLNTKDIKSDITEAIKYAPCVGAANGGLNMLVMVLTGFVPTAVLFPVVMSGVVIITFIASVAFFKERFTNKQLIGYVLGVASIVLINL